MLQTIKEMISVSVIIAAIGGTFISKNASGERKGSQVLQGQGGKDVIDKSYGGA